MAFMNDLTRRGTLELACLIKGEEVSPVEVIEVHLAAIERLNPALNAVVTVVAPSPPIGWPHIGSTDRDRATGIAT